MEEKVDGTTDTPAAMWRVFGKEDPHGDRYDCRREQLCGGKFTDDELANEVFLDPTIANLTAAKDRIRWLSRQNENARALLDSTTVKPHPESEWSEQDGDVLWWKFPVTEAPWVGTPLDYDWIPGYHTHWTPLPEIPEQPTTEPTEQTDGNE